MLNPGLQAFGDTCRLKFEWNRAQKHRILDCRFLGFPRYGEKSLRTTDVESKYDLSASHKSTRYTKEKPRTITTTTHKNISTNEISSFPEVVLILHGIVAYLSLCFVLTSRFGFRGAAQFRLQCTNKANLSDHLSVLLFQTSSCSRCCLWAGVIARVGTSGRR